MLHRSSSLQITKKDKCGSFKSLALSSERMEWKVKNKRAVNNLSLELAQQQPLFSRKARKARDIGKPLKATRRAKFSCDVSI